MRTKIVWSWGLIAIALWVGAAFGSQNQSDHKLLFEKAKFAMETKGDLQGAIKLFQEIVAKYPKEKEYASKAQLYIGLCYEKLGNSEAIKAYELVLKNFADRPEEVAVARERLAALRQETAAAAAIVNLPMGTMYLEPYALSPDGTKVLGWNFDTGDNIAFYDTVADRTELITHFDWSEESFWANCPVWSPDGKQIAFSQNPNKPGSKAVEVYAADLKGKSRLLSRVEAHEIWPEDWLRDGSAIVVFCIYQDGAFALGLIPAAGGALKTLCPVQRVTFGSNASASPDGRFIVFSDGSLGARDLRIIGVDGGSSEVLIAHPADDYDPLWSPDGNHIIFKSNRHGGDALWGLTVNNGRAAGEPFLITDLAPGISPLNWISQGVAFSKTININDVYIQSIDPQTYEPVGKPRLIPYTPTGINSSPRWSPDGKYIAFTTNPLGRPWQSRIVVLPSEGGNAREYPIPIYRWYLITHTLSWLPDSSGIGFATYLANVETRQNTLLQLDISSGEWKTWPLPGVGDNNWTPIEWGSDGRSFFYARQSFLQVEPGILKQEMATGKEGYIHRLERGKGETVMNLRRSRDNKWLFIDLDKDSMLDESKSTAEILALDLDTGKVRTVYRGADDVGSLSLSPDGRTLLVLSDLEPNYGIAENLAIISVGGGPLKRLKIELTWPKGDGFLHGFAAPDWSPDGKQIAFTTWSAKDETFLMKNVIPKEKH